MRRTFLSLVLARRFARGPALARSASVVLVTAAFLIGMFVTLRSLTLSGEQRAEQELGRFATAVDLGGVEELAPGERSAARGPTVELKAFDVQPTGLDRPRTYFSEIEWRSRPFPERFVLRSGRWPARPGEVALTNADVLGRAAGEPLSVLSGHHELMVVGTAADHYGRYPTILAAPGTWETLDPELSESFPTLAAYARVYSANEDVEDLVRRLSETLARQPGAPARRAVSDTLAASATTRSGVVSGRERSWIDRLPAAYHVPSLVLPLVAVLLVFGLNDRRLRRALTSLIDVGVDRRQAVAGLALAVIAWALAAALAGVALGLGLAVAARPILRELHPLPLSPVGGLMAPTARLVAMVLLGGAVGAIALHADAPHRTTATRSARRRDARRLAALVAGCAAVLQLPALDSTPRAMVLAGMLGAAAVLLTPEALSCVLRVMPERAGRTRLARRQLLADRGRAVIAAAMLAASIGLPLGFLTLLDTMVSTAEAGIASSVRPGQLALAGLGGTFDPPSRAVVSTARAELGPAHAAIPVRFLHSAQQFVSPACGEGRFVLALDRPEHISGLLDHRLSPGESATLRRGGMLVWDRTDRSTCVLRSDSADGTITETAPLPIARASAPTVSWRAGTSGVLLTRTARRLRLPVSTGAVLFAGISDPQAAAVRSAVLAAGLDPEQVLVYEPPRPAAPPLALSLAAVGLALLTLLTSLTVAQSQATALRRYLGTLIAIGVPTGWARQVLMIEHAVVVSVGTALASVIAIPPVLVAVWRLPGFVLSVPWLQLMAMVGTVYLASILALLAASRRLHPH